MSKLIYADEVKKRFPIMENDFGMVVNETLHKELDKIPTVKAISLEKVKQARDKIENLTPWDEGLVEMHEVLSVLDKLIEEVEE